MATKQELEHSLKMRRLQLFQQGLKYLAVVVAVWIICRYAFFGLRELAGRSTSADILMNIVVGLRTSKGLALVISWLLTGSAVTGWSLERNGRKRLIERFHPEDRQIQLKVDPRKQSSGITLRGETRPGDQ